MYSQESLAKKVIPIMRCNFCNRGKDEIGVELLIASQLPGVYICDGCLATALTTLLRHRPNQKRKLMRILERVK